MTRAGSDSRQELVFFSAVRVAEENGRFYVDPSNWLRLNLLLKPFSSVRLVSVITQNKGEDWRLLSEPFTVIPAQKDFQPRGQSNSWFKKILFVLWSLVLPFRYANQARKAGAVGFVWIVEPIAIAGLLLALIWRKPLYSVVIGSPYKSFELKSRISSSFVYRLFNRGAAFGARRIDRLIVRYSTLLLVTGPRLSQELGAGIPFSTSVFSKNDIVYREDTCGGETIQWAYSGGISMQKGVDLFLQALASVRSTDPRHKALLIGRVDPQFPLQHLLRTLDLEEHVRVVGAQPWERVLSLLRECDVYVFLSLHEGMPKAPLEAMTQGLPVIVANSGAEQYVVNGVNGLVVSVRSVSLAAESVLHLVANSDLRRRLILEGYKTAQTRTYESSVLEVKDVLRSHFPNLVRTVGDNL